MNYDENKAIEFLRTNGVEVRYEPVAYMTSSKNSMKYIFGEHCGSTNYTESLEPLSIRDAVDRVKRQIETCNKMTLKGKDLK